jgi:hypothetical protein
VLQNARLAEIAGRKEVQHPTMTNWRYRLLLWMIALAALPD